MPQVPTLAGSTEITNRGDYLSWAFSGVGWMLCHLVDPIVIRLIFSALRCSKPAVKVADINQS